MKPAKWIGRFPHWKKKFNSEDLGLLKFVIVDLERDQSYSISLEDLKELMK
jgi:hypothetical protein